MSFELIQANANNLPLADDSVDLIITSPPYFALRSYRDDGEHYDDQIGSEATPTQFLDALLACTAEMNRVLKPTGSIFVNLGDKYAGTGGANSNTGLGLEDSTDADVDNRGSARNNTRQTNQFRPKTLLGLPWRYAIQCIDELNLILRSEIIWHKPNGLPESVTDRTRRNHEQWFHLTKEPRYYSAIDHIREPQLFTGGEGSPHQKRISGKGIKHREFTSNKADYNPLGRLPGSVWTIPTEPLTNIPSHLPQHYAAFPQEWPRRLALAFSPPNGTILDPFAGTGTTIGVAHTLGRHGIGIDLSNDYLRLAHWRIAESGHFEKTYQRSSAEGAVLPLTPPPTTLTGQESLL